MAETRWEQARALERARGHGGYAAHFAQLIAGGVDVEGEARLADVLVGRRSMILDAGSGMGRVGAALQQRGHRVVGVDLDEEVLAQSRVTYPDLPVVQSRLDELTPEKLTADGHPTSYDLVVCVGNVMTLLAPDTERVVLSNLRALLASGGRMLVGHHLGGGPAETARSYSVSEFVTDAEAAGLEIESRFASFDLRPFDDNSEFAVHVLRRVSSGGERSG